ncbi:hypothetical protein Pmani_036043 [Petrolisthes manimaculis]|uniref:Uncharacterized protein n=1 Tax=Petrolisthes manimaculis TaxID=1843537 RepID=A0AAE1NJC1_9EUCA|nr:hypothetical protein Pmani_036043 [Petrolisthes manimaculis]
MNGARRGREEQRWSGKGQGAKRGREGAKLCRKQHLSPYTQGETGTADGGREGGEGGEKDSGDKVERKEGRKEGLRDRVTKEKMEGNGGGDGGEASKTSTPPQQRNTTTLTWKKRTKYEEPM